MIKCDEIGAVFLQDKVSHIRDNVVISCSSTPTSSPASHSHQLTAMSSVSAILPVNSTDLNEIVKCLKSCTCSLDCFPVKLFKDMFNCSRNDTKILLTAPCSLTFSVILSSVPLSQLLYPSVINS